MSIRKEFVAASPLVDGGKTLLHSHPRCPDLIGTFILNPLRITKYNTVNIKISVTEILAIHKIHVQCQSDLESGLVCIAAYCNTDGIITVRISNLSKSKIIGAPRIWSYQAYS